MISVFNFVPLSFVTKSQTLLFFGFFGLSKNKKQTAVINITRQRIFFVTRLELVSYAIMMNNRVVERKSTEKQLKLNLRPRSPQFKSSALTHSCTLDTSSLIRFALFSRRPTIKNDHIRSKRSPNRSTTPVDFGVDKLLGNWGPAQPGEGDALCHLCHLFN